MTISFLFLTVYIELEKLLGDDDQNNVKHLHSEIKKRKGNVSFDVWRFNMSSRIKIRVDHRICNSLIA